ncbi:MAG: phosphoribosylanthranilate isomerase [Pseudomonadota bacterium]
MTMIKICGVRDGAVLAAAIAAGATHIGFVFHPKSPRNLTVDAAIAAKEDAAHAGPLPTIVALIADQDTANIEALSADLAPDIIQCHGGETPAQMLALRAQLPPAVRLWKALGVHTIDDLRIAPAFGPAVDALVLDARAPAGAAYGGGHGHAFDWSVLGEGVAAGHLGAIPWVLAGGLTPENVEAAIAQIAHLPGFAGVDVSSGVESAPGQKDPAAIAAFIRRARRAMHGA